MNRKLIVVAMCVATAPVLLGAEGGCGDSPVFSQTAAPDVSGAWQVAYEDRIAVEIKVGGAVYTEEVGLQGGVISVTHEGQPLMFDLDCAREDVVCPSETLATEVNLVQRNEEFPHRMFVQIPQQTCAGTTAAPEPSECGEGTLNPDCDDVCSGEVTTQVAEAFGVINEPGDHFDVALGAGLATNGVNCALLKLSAAGADIVSTGGPESGDWRATSIENGQIVTAFGGACLWAGDPEMNGELEALLLTASVSFSVPFTAARN